MAHPPGGRCPQCRAALVEEPGYQPWCEQCDWNLRGDPPPALNAVDRWWARVDRRLSRPLYRALEHGRADSRWPSPTTLVAYALSAVVLLGTFGLLALGVASLVRGFPDPYAIGLGLLCLGVFWVLRPRARAAPENVLDRSAIPSLYELVDRVAGAVGTRRVAGIAVTPEFNAAYVAAGWRRRTYLAIGLPLWSVLEPQERVHVVAHELAHGVNRDPARTFLFSSAIAALWNAYFLLTPDEFLPEGGSLTALIAIPFKLVFLVLAQGFRAAAVGLAVLVFADSRRAELRADLMAARLAGTRAAIDGLGRLLFGETVASMTYLTPQPGRFEQMRNQERLVPPGERRRRLRVNALRDASLFTSHPPVALRIEHLRRAPPLPATFVLGAGESSRIDAEMAPLAPRVERILIDEAAG